MASQPLDLLAPFGTEPDDRWFRTAYKWTRDEIFQWMKETAQAEGPPGEILMQLYEYITRLSLPDGPLYKDRDRQPFSHIARLVNDKFGQEGETSKFFVNGWSIRPKLDSAPETAPGPVPGWWCPYDLLGLFLSLLGPAPDAANKNNFYLPLTAVYARWCSRIAGRPRGWRWNLPVQERGEGDFPFVFQCTWHTTVDETTKRQLGQYFLGASTAGDEFRKAFTGSWREKVQEARFDMLFTCQKVSMVQRNDFKDKRAPSQITPGGTKVPFGNCAETYPFATIFLENKKQNKTSMAGLALQRDFMEENEYPEYNEYKDGEIWLKLMGPCANCRKLIDNAGGNKSKFRNDLDWDKAPGRS